jgi:capsular exopolysaccharide synthesis family protein
MAKTYEAMIKAEEAAQSKKETDDRDPHHSGAPSPVDRGRSTIESRLPQGGRGRTSEEYSRLKINILSANPDVKVKTLLFSSPTGGEGASTVLTDFAILLAGQGEKVLLVDANFRSPSLHERFHLGSDNGLAELLLQKSTLQQVIKETGVRNLSVITNGMADRGPSTVDDGPFNPENLSNAIAPYLEKMKEEMDWVLFDAPPVNHFDEGLALSGKVDGVVMVIQAEKTRWEVAQSAKQRLEDSGGRILGVVLNKRRFYIPEWLYETI